MTTQVEIYGMKYKIKGSDDPGQIQNVARLVHQRMLEIGQMDPRLDVTRIAVLAAVNLADELIKVQVQFDDLLKCLEEEATRLQKR